MVEGCERQPGVLGLALARRKLLRGRVHRLGQVFHGRVQDELGDDLQVAQGVLLGAVAAEGGGEDDDRRIGAEGVEEAERGEVDAPFGVDRRHPGDRPGSHNVDQGLVDLHDIRGGNIDDHSIDPAQGVGWVVQFHGLAGQPERPERIDHDGQLVGPGRVAAGDDGAGVRAVGNAAGMKRDRRLLDAPPAAEPASNIVQDLVGLHVRMGVRHLDRLGMRVEHPGANVQTTNPAASNVCCTGGG